MHNASVFFDIGNSNAKFSTKNGIAILTHNMALPIGATILKANARF